MLKITSLITDLANYEDVLYNGTEDEFIGELMDINGFMTFIVHDALDQNKRVKLYVRAATVISAEIDNIKTQPEKNSLHMTDNGSVETGTSSYEKKLEEELKEEKAVQEAAKIAAYIDTILGDALRIYELNESEETMAKIYSNILELIILKDDGNQDEESAAYNFINVVDDVCKFIDFWEIEDTKDCNYGNLLSILTGDPEFLLQRIENTKKGSLYTMDDYYKAKKEAEELDKAEARKNRIN